jgi:hypothetical protein
MHVILLESRYITMNTQLTLNNILTGLLMIVQVQVGVKTEYKMYGCRSI